MKPSSETINSSRQMEEARQILKHLECLCMGCAKIATRSGLNCVQRYLGAKNMHLLMKIAIWELKQNIKA